MDIRVEDGYPTRIQGEPELLERHDPTVWGSAADGPIDSATLAGHDARGYSNVENLLSRVEVEAYWNDLIHLTGRPQLRGDERVITEPKSDEVRSIFDVHLLSDLVGELVRDPRVLDRAQQILGSEVYIHQSRVNYMPGFEGTGFYWHSDFETWHAEDGMPAPRAVSCSIALTDNFAFNGGLMVIPGSHRTFVQCAGGTPRNNYKRSLKAQRAGVPSQDNVSKMAAEHGIEQFTGAAGDALFFDSNVLHGSGNNITPYMRSNIFLVFNSVENPLGQPFSAAEPRPTFIAGRDFTPLTR